MASRRICSIVAGVLYLRVVLRVTLVAHSQLHLMKMVFDRVCDNLSVVPGT